MEPEHCSEVCSAGLQRVRPVRENGDSLYAWAPLLLSSAHLGRDWAAAGLVMAQGGGLFPNLTVPTWARHKIGNAGNWASRDPEVSRSAALPRCLKCTYFEVILTAMVEGLLSFIFLIIFLLMEEGIVSSFPKWVHWHKLKYACTQRTLLQGNRGLHWVQSWDQSRHHRCSERRHIEQARIIMARWWKLAVRYWEARPGLQDGEDVQCDGRGWLQIMWSLHFISLCLLSLISNMKSSWLAYYYALLSSEVS